MRVGDDAGRRRLALVAAVVGPVAVCGALVPFRGSVDPTNAALLLVLVVVAVAAVGYRVAGAVAAVSAGVWFDFFLTRPYQRFTISDGTDIQTAVLLLLVGLGVSQLAFWGRGQQARASRDEGYLAGLFAASDAAADQSGSPSGLVDGVCRQLVELLGVAACRFDYGTGLGHPRIARNGTVRWERQSWDVSARGLPTAKETELLVYSAGSYRGRFLLTARAGTRPTARQLQVATALADEVGSAIAGYSGQRS